MVWVNDYWLCHWMVLKMPCSAAQELVQLMESALWYCIDYKNLDDTALLGTGTGSRHDNHKLNNIVYIVYSPNCQYHKYTHSNMHLKVTLNIIRRQASRVLVSYLVLTTYKSRETNTRASTTFCSYYMNPVPWAKVLRVWPWSLHFDFLFIPTNTNTIFGFTA